MGEPVTTTAPSAGPETAPVIDSIEPAVVAPVLPVVPRDGFHDSREVAAAMAQGLPTQDGYPLHPAAQEILREARSGVAAVRQWADYLDGQLNRAAAIGTGRS